MVGDTIDKQMLVDFANDKCFLNKINELTLFQIACLYWIYNGVGIWNTQIISKLEQKVTYYVEQEI
jgi:hypothetical protein